MATIADRVALMQIRNIISLKNRYANLRNTIICQEAGVLRSKEKQRCKDTLLSKYIKSNEFTFGT